MAKILYLSCHSILEYEEIKLLTELGHEVFSPGAYVEPDNPGDSSLRPNIPELTYNPEVLEKFHAIGRMYPGKDGKDYLTEELVNYFDIVIVMHLPRWIQLNWEVLKNKRVIWRTIGQSVSNVEYDLKSYRDCGLQIVRYSPKERNIPGYIGEDALIRFYKDPEQYSGWTGHQKRVITFAQHMKARDQACNYTFFEKTTRSFDRCLFGPGSENVGKWGAGKVSYGQLKQELRDNRVYFYTGTHPASYTLNFMEAWMTGIPIVAVGSKHGNASYFSGHDLYEVSDLLENNKTGFISDDPEELKKYIKLLFENKELASEISVASRKEAIKIFGKDQIMKQWRSFLDEN